MLPGRQHATWSLNRGVRRAQRRFCTTLSILRGHIYCEPHRPWGEIGRSLFTAVSGILLVRW